MLAQAPPDLPGTRVRVSHATLDGLTGLVVNTSDVNSSCLVTIDGFPPGVYLSIDAGFLQPVKDQPPKR